MSTALLVIDVQHALCSGEHAAFESRQVVDRINHVIRQARAAGAPVIFVQHEEQGGPFAHGAAGWKLDADLDTMPSDLYVRKTACDAFHKTGLDDILTARGIKQLIVCGFQTDFCVDTTIRRALGLGFSVTLVADGHSTLDNGVLKAAQIVAHHNVTLANLDSLALGSAQCRRRPCESRPEKGALTMNQLREECHRALKRMLANGPLNGVPKRPSDQHLLVTLAAAHFRPGKAYREGEVNEVLKGWMQPFCDCDGIDHVTLRRMLVDSHLLSRTISGTSYRVNPERMAETEAVVAIEPAEVLAEVRTERETRKHRHAS